MKIEYLLIKKKNDFCSVTELFKNLLLSNSRLKITQSHITLSKYTFDYKLSMSEVKFKKREETVFSFEVSTNNGKEDCKALEEFDDLLSRINGECGNQFQINTIWDDVSISYAKNLYPRMIEVENQLRKLIYLFMIKTVGSTWFSTSVPPDFETAVKKTAEKNKQVTILTNQLYYADFIQLATFLFTPYTTKPFTQTLIQEIKANLANNELTKKLNELIETYEAKSNWERFFAKKIPIDDLNAKWQRLYLYRNSVAHAKRLRESDYVEAEKLISELSSAFVASLDHVDDVKLNEEETNAIQEVANDTIHINDFYVQLLSGLTTNESDCKSPNFISQIYEIKPDLFQHYSSLEKAINSTIDLNSLRLSTFLNKEEKCDSYKFANASENIAQNVVDLKSLELLSTEPRVSTSDLSTLSIKVDTDIGSCTSIKKTENKE